MSAKKFIIFFLVGVFVLTAFSPPVTFKQVNTSPIAAPQAAGTVQVTIINKTGANVILYMTGAAYQTLTIKPGKTKVDLLKGTYQISYKACGITKNETVVIKKKGFKLYLECGVGKTKKGVKITIYNNTGGTLILNLYGPATYTFTFYAGKYKIYLIKGTYTYTAIGCGGYYETGTIKIKNSIKWKWWCTWW